MDNIPEKLKRARRSLDSLTQVNILHDWQFDGSLGKWYLHISIQIDTRSEFVPNVSQWYVVVLPDYPKGDIKIFPDIDNSICVTMYHQSNNARIEKNGLWRKGNLCLDLNTLELYDAEPNSIDYRVLYHVKRAIDWLGAAAKNELVKETDLFDLPDFSPISDLTKKFVFNEDTVSFMQWEDTETYFGFAELDRLPHFPSVFYVKRFANLRNTSVHLVTWGSYMAESFLDSKRIAPWILLKSIPVHNNWQPPETLHELISICDSQGISIINVLKSISSRLRDGKQHFLLLGFPIPKYFFGEDELIFWQAISFPVLSYGKYTADGFRNNEKGYWLRDRQEILCDTMTLDWIESENWNQNEISERGKMGEELIRKSVLVIGAGCIAACVSEIFVRSGVYNLTIMDWDLFEVGNLVRHTLSISEIGLFKESTLCEHLNRINPHARVEYINEQLFQNDSGEINVDLEKYYVIIDCTGNNSVLDILSQVDFSRTVNVISVSTGLGADHLYITMQRGTKVSFVSFYELIEQYIYMDREKYDKMEFPRNGTGCWHPTFPARSDDVWMAASTATKLIDKFVADDSSKNISMVFEQQEADGYFSGYNLINKCNG